MQLTKYSIPQVTDAIIRKAKEVHITTGRMIQEGNTDLQTKDRHAIDVAKITISQLNATIALKHAMDVEKLDI